MGWKERIFGKFPSREEAHRRQQQRDARDAKEKLDAHRKILLEEARRLAAPMSWETNANTGTTGFTSTNQLTSASGMSGISYQQLFQKNAMYASSAFRNMYSSTHIPTTPPPPKELTPEEKAEQQEQLLEDQEKERRRVELEDEHWAGIMDGIVQEPRTVLGGGENA
jgi:hypothetical protein